MTNNTKKSRRIELSQTPPPSTVEAILNRDDLLGQLREFEREDLGSTRFMLMIGVRDDGSTYIRRGGYITHLEIGGLGCFIDQIVEMLHDSLDEDSGQQVQ